MPEEQEAETVAPEIAESDTQDADTSDVAETQDGSLTTDSEASTESDDSHDTEDQSTVKPESEEEEIDWAAKYREAEENFKRSQAGYVRKINEEREVNNLLKQALEERLAKAQEEPKQPETPSVAPETLRLYDAFEKQLSKATTNEERQAVAERWGDEFTEEDIAGIQAMKRRERDIQRRLAAGDSAPLQDIISREVEQRLQQKEQERLQQEQLQRDYQKHMELFTREGVLDKVTERYDEFQQGIQSGLTAMEIIERWDREDENKTLKSQLAKLTAKEVKEKEVSRLNRSGDMATRDRSPNQIKDADQIYQEAKREWEKRGITSEKGQYKVLSEFLNKYR